MFCLIFLKDTSICSQGTNYNTRCHWYVPEWTLNHIITTPLKSSPRWTAMLIIIKWRPTPLWKRPSGVVSPFPPPQHHAVVILFPTTLVTPKQPSLLLRLNPTTTTTHHHYHAQPSTIQSKYVSIQKISNQKHLIYHKTPIKIYKT